MVLSDADIHENNLRRLKKNSIMNYRIFGPAQL